MPVMSARIVMSLESPCVRLADNGNGNAGHEQNVCEILICPYCKCYLRREVDSLRINTPHDAFATWYSLFNQID